MKPEAAAIDKNLRKGLKPLIRMAELVRKRDR